MNQQYIDFERALKSKFFELRPSFTKSSDTPLQDLAADPVFKKLFIIDRSASDKSIFEAGYLLWEECGRDMDKFFDLFVVKVENDRLVLEEIENDPSV